MTECCVGTVIRETNECTTCHCSHIRSYWLLHCQTSLLSVLTIRYACIPSVIHRHHGNQSIVLEYSKTLSLMHDFYASRILNECGPQRVICKIKLHCHICRLFRARARVCVCVCAACVDGMKPPPGTTLQCFTLPVNPVTGHLTAYYYSTPFM